MLALVEASQTSIDAVRRFVASAIEFINTAFTPTRLQPTPLEEINLSGSI
jgi:hypothetical protein